MNNDKPISVDSLSTFLEKILQLEGEEEIIYRGQSDEKWEITSSAYRRLNKPHSNELLDYNIELVKRARRYPKELKETTADINILAELQHHGAATSLIDFTKSALIALWFACQDKKTNGKVFCLDIGSFGEFLEVSENEEKENLENILTLEFREDKSSDKSSDNVSRSGNRSGEGGKIAKWEPPITDNRILKQDSFFIFNKTGKLDGFAKILIICKENKTDILNELEQISNFSEETIFPDFYGFSQNNSADKPYGPQDTKAYFQRGNKNLREGEYKEAINDYNEAIKLDPQSAHAYYNRGTAYYALKQYQDAINDYDEAIELNPQSANAYNNRGNLYCALKRYQEAVNDYNEVIKLNPQSADAYNNRGTVRSELQQYPEAINNYNKAIELNPQSANAYYNRGLAYSELQRYQEAINDYNKAIELDPQYADAYNNRGGAHHALGEYQKAINDCDKVIELNPQYANVYYNRGTAHLCLEQYQEALTDFSSAKTLFKKEENIAMVKKCEREITKLSERCKQ